MAEQDPSCENLAPALEYIVPAEENHKFSKPLNPDAPSFYPSGKFGDNLNFPAFDLQQLQNLSINPGLPHIGGQRSSDIVCNNVFSLEHQGMTFDNTGHNPVVLQNEGLHDSIQTQMSMYPPYLVNQNFMPPSNYMPPVHNYYYEYSQHMESLRPPFQHRAKAARGLNSNLRNFPGDVTSNSNAMSNPTVSNLNTVQDRKHPKPQLNRKSQNSWSQLNSERDKRKGRSKESLISTGNHHIYPKNQNNTGRVSNSGYVGEDQAHSDTSCLLHASQSTLESGGVLNSNFLSVSSAKECNNINSVVLPNKSSSHGQSRASQEYGRQNRNETHKRKKQLSHSSASRNFKNSAAGAQPHPSQISHNQEGLNLKVTTHSDLVQSSYSSDKKNRLSWSNSKEVKNAPLQQKQTADGDLYHENCEGQKIDSVDQPCNAEMKEADQFSNTAAADTLRSKKAGEKPRYADICSKTAVIEPTKSISTSGSKNTSQSIVGDTSKASDSKATTQSDHASHDVFVPCHDSKDDPVVEYVISDTVSSIQSDPPVVSQSSEISEPVYSNANNTTVMHELSSGNETNVPSQFVTSGDVTNTVMPPHVEAEGGECNYVTARMPIPILNNCRLPTDYIHTSVNANDKMTGQQCILEQSIITNAVAGFAISPDTNVAQNFFNESYLTKGGSTIDENPVENVTDSFSEICPSQDVKTLFPSGSDFIDKQVLCEVDMSNKHKNFGEVFCSAFVESATDADSATMPLIVSDDANIISCSSENADDTKNIDKFQDITEAKTEVAGVESIEAIRNFAEKDLSVDAECHEAPLKSSFECSNVENNISPSPFAAQEHEDALAVDCSPVRKYDRSDLLSLFFQALELRVISPSRSYGSSEIRKDFKQRTDGSHYNSASSVGFFRGSGNTESSNKSSVRSHPREDNFSDMRSGYGAKKGQVRRSDRDAKKEKSMAMDGFFREERATEFEQWRPSPVACGKWLQKQREEKSHITLAVVRKLTALLNKLTFERFHGLLEEIKELLTTNELFEKFVGLVVVKAATQHHFIRMYTALCGELKTHAEQNLTGVDFKRMLLNLCQDMFVEYTKPMEMPEGMNSIEEFQFDVAYKKRMKGFMTFISELGAKKMFSSKHLFQCVMDLFEASKACGTDISGTCHRCHCLEAICSILNAVGYLLVHEGCKQRNDALKVFVELESISKDTTLDFRIRCLLQDVLDNKEDGWRKMLQQKQSGPTSLSVLYARLHNEYPDAAIPAYEPVNNSVTSYSAPQSAPQVETSNKFNDDYYSKSNTSRSFVAPSKSESRFNSPAFEKESSPIKDDSVYVDEVKSLLLRSLDCLPYSDIKNMMRDLAIPSSVQESICGKIFVFIGEKYSVHDESNDKKRDKLYLTFLNLLQDQILLTNAFQFSVDRFFSTDSDGICPYEDLLKDVPFLPRTMKHFFGTFLEQHNPDPSVLTTKVIGSWKINAGC